MHHCVHVGMIKDPASRSVMVVAITTNILLLLGIFHRCSLHGWRRFWSLLIMETWPQLIRRACIGKFQVTWWHFQKAFITLTLWQVALQLRRRGTLPKGNFCAKLTSCCRNFNGFIVSGGISKHFAIQRYRKSWAGTQSGCANPFVTQSQSINRIVQWYEVDCQEIGSASHWSGDHHRKQCRQTCVHTSHHHVPLWDWLAICFASSSISSSSGICNHNQQESRSDIQQRWGISATSGLFPWSAVCCYFTGHK